MALTTPDAFALVDERRAISWRELDSLLNRAANRLLISRLGLGERMGVFATNSVECAVAYLASLHAGISSVPINSHLTVDEVAQILIASSARILFAGPETVGIARMAATWAGIEAVVAWRTEPGAGVTAWTDWLAAAPDVDPPTHMVPRPHLHFTSGTTGEPKSTETSPAVFPRRDTVAEFFATLHEQAATADSRSPSLVIGPLYHVGPLHMLHTVAIGISLVIMSRFEAQAALKTIEQYRVKTALMVPTHFQQLLALPQAVRDRYDVSSLVGVFHSGAACPPDVKRRMLDWFGPVLIEAYGSTESGATNVITSEEWLRKPGSVGRTVPPFEVLVVAGDGRHLGPNQVGALYFRDVSGRGIVYYDDPEKTRAAHLEPGVFTLGEVGYYDEDGYVFITDRASDMIVSGGVNIYPAEAEQVLIRHPEVADVAVVGAPNADMGEELKAIVVPRDPDGPPDVLELDLFCRERLAGFKCPRSYDFVPDLGRNVLGKVNKRELRRRYWPTGRTIGG